MILMAKASEAVAVDVLPGGIQGVSKTHLDGLAWHTGINHTRQLFLESTGLIMDTHPQHLLTQAHIEKRKFLFGDSLSTAPLRIWR